MKALRWIVPVLIVAAAITFRLLGTEGPAAPAEQTPIPVRTSRPLRGDIARNLRLNAHVESESMVTVLPLVSGILQELFVDIGQEVKKGAVIARVDAARYELQLKQAEAAYFSAKSAYDRVAQLYRAGATTQQNYDQAKAQYDAYASQYELARLQLGYATVTSPVDGVVLVKHLSVGAIAAPERPLVTIGDLSELVVRARIPERYYRAFQRGLGSMAIRVRAPDGDDYAGRLKSVSPFVSADTKNFEATVSVLGDLAALRPGMFVRLSFELERWNGALSLPYEALAGGDRLWYVEDGRAKSVSFEPKDGSDERFVVPEEFEGLEFVVEGAYFLRDGSPVRPVNRGTD